MPWTADLMDSLTGRTFVVTGANAGIGFETAAMLSRLGARVILACRNPDKGADAIKRIHSSQPSAVVHLAHLDLSSLASVRKFAAEIEQVYPSLDGLINNAGVMMPPLGRTAEGFEAQFGCNVVGHFLLTGLLLPLLNRAPAARVVTLSSVAHWVGKIDFANLNAERGYSKAGAYAQSKLADLMFAYELQRRLLRAGSRTISVGAHPGATQSSLGRHSIVLTTIANAMGQPTADGALPSLRAAIDPAVQGGEYYGPDGFATLRGAAVRQRSSRRSYDEATARALWEATERLCGERFL